ncbi:uncharacterized protein ISCGN_020726 [Ixodes scapularis]
MLTGSSGLKRPAAASSHDSPVGGSSPVNLSLAGTRDVQIIASGQLDAIDMVGPAIQSIASDTSVASSCTCFVPRASVGTDRSCRHRHTRRHYSSALPQHSRFNCRLQFEGQPPNCRPRTSVLTVRLPYHLMVR